MYIGMTKTNLTLTMHATTSQAPDKIGETLSPQISKIEPYAIKNSGQQVFFKPSWLSETEMVHALNIVMKESCLL